jgi:lysylphosphatidylglycerol synthetase-like protein (DUF2156 family)
LAAEPSGHPREVVAAVQEVTDRAQVLVREEIELAKAEITQKLQSLVKGAAIGAAAGVFVLGALLLVLHGFALLIWYAVPFGNNQTVFWGYFIMAALLLIVAAIAGYVAMKMFKKGTPPKPELAIEEAQRIKQTVQG